MAAEVLSFQQEEGKTAYYATFVSDGNPVTIQIKNKGGMVTVFANIEVRIMGLRYTESHLTGKKKLLLDSVRLMTLKPYRFRIFQTVH